MKKYYGIQFIVDGVYGEITHATLTQKLDKTFNEYTASNITINMPDVHFSVKVRDGETGEDLFDACDIKGLPQYINLDMGTYFKMAQLREIRNSSQYQPALKIDFQKLSDEVVKNIVKTLDESIYKNKTTNI